MRVKEGRMQWQRKDGGNACTSCTKSANSLGRERKVLVREWTAIAIDWLGVVSMRGLDPRPPRSHGLLAPSLMGHFRKYIIGYCV